MTSGAPGEHPPARSGEAPRGAPELVVVTGATGAGKTAYLTRTARSARADGAIVAWGRSGGGGAAPLSPWTDVVEQLGRSVGPGAAGPGLTPAAGRAARFEAVAEVLVVAAADAPLVVLLDDVHDADPAGVVLARHLVGRSDFPGLLLVVAHAAVPGGARGVRARVLAGLHARATRVVDLGEPPAPARGRAAARLAELPGPVVEVLGLAATWGREAATADIAAVAGCDPTAVVDHLCAAAGAGVVTRVPPDRWAFADESLRLAVLDRLGRETRLDAAARATARLAGAARADAVVARATHALAAADRSTSDAELAVEVCAAAADSVRGTSPELAAELLGAADECAARLGRRPLGLVHAHADALAAAGGRADARALLLDALGDPAAHQEDSGVAGVVRRLAGLGPLDDELLERARATRSALADDDVGAADLDHLLALADGPAEVAAAGLDRVRAGGDSDALLDALAAAHHAAAGPDGVARARAVADELVRVATASGHEVLRLLGTAWAAEARQRAGAPADAEALLRTVRAEADLVDAPEVELAAARLEVLRCLRDGRLVDARARAGAVGGGVATVVDRTVAWLGGEPPPSRAAGTGPDLLTALAQARVEATSGHLDAAAAALERALPARLGELPRGPAWLAELATVLDVARTLGDRQRAAEAAELLRPYEDLPALAAGAAVCLGAVGRALGLAAATLDDPHAAVAHLVRAVEANRRLANRPLVAVTRADLADALVARDADGDLDAAVAALAQAAKEARALGLHERAERWWAQAASLHDRRRAGAALLRHEHDRWVVRAGDHHVIAPDLIGFRYLGVLLERPGEELAPLELVGGAFGRWGIELDDRTSIDAYRRRVRQIDAELAQVDVADDVARVETLRGERDVLRGELAAVLGMTDRRSAAGPAERARTTVCRAIARAIASLETADAELAEELRSTVVTGATCRYVPDPARPRHWEVEVVLDR